MTVQAIPGKPTPQDKKFVVPIQVLVPVGSLGLVPDGKDHVANLSLTVVTKDAKGNTKPAQAMELRLRLTEAQLEDDRERRSEHPAAARPRAAGDRHRRARSHQPAIPRPRRISIDPREPERRRPVELRAPGIACSAR